MTKLNTIKTVSVNVATNVTRNIKDAGRKVAKTAKKFASKAPETETVEVTTEAAESKDTWMPLIEKIRGMFKQQQATAKNKPFFVPDHHKISEVNGNLIILNNRLWGIVSAAIRESYNDQRLFEADGNVKQEFIQMTLNEMYHRGIFSYALYEGDPKKITFYLTKNQATNLFGI